MRMTPDDLVGFCRTFAAQWWGGAAIDTPPEAWPALMAYVTDPTLWPRAKYLLRNDDGAIGMLQALVHMAASSSPQAGVAVAGFPVMAKGVLQGNTDHIEGFEGVNGLDAQLAELLDVRDGSIRVVPKLVDAKALTALSPAQLRRMCEELWADRDSPLLAPARPWEAWDEQMLVVLAVLRDPTINNPPSRLAAEAVQQHLSAQVAGAPLYLAAQPLQPLHRLILAAEMFRVQKALRAVTGPWPLTLIQTEGEWVLRSKMSEVPLSIPGAPEGWLLGAVKSKVASVGGTLTVEDRRASGKAAPAAPIPVSPAG